MALLMLGFVLGLIASPLIRSWIVWREYKSANREAWLAEQTLRRLEEEPDPVDDGAPADRTWP